MVNYCQQTKTEIMILTQQNLIHKNAFMQIKSESESPGETDALFQFTLTLPPVLTLNKIYITTITNE